jgi:hypothetical protein
VWLSVAGLALATVATVGLVLIRDADGPRGVYVAPRMDAQGNIVPGHVEPAAK